LQLTVWSAVSSEGQLRDLWTFHCTAVFVSVS